MSKKKHARAQSSDVAHRPTEAAEYAIIGKDLARVLLLNVLYFAGILLVYYTNKQSQYLEHFFSRLFHW